VRVSFAEFTLDRKTRQLLRDGGELHLEPKAFALLDLLLARRPEAVSKHDIQVRLWPDTFVSEANLTSLVAQIRQALGDHPKRPRFVRTVHGFGYAFSAEATEVWAQVGAPPAGHCLVWQRRMLPLEAGENVLGRAEDVAVRIEAPGVSRRHARILLAQDQVTLEDLGSKNGTYLNERRLEAPAVLDDGDTFRLGRQLLVYRRLSAGGSTQTEADA
jgi:DNA-binding winged helix-turn-helix (wHTH) protein